MSKMQNALVNPPLCGYAWCTDDRPNNERENGRIRDSKEEQAEISMELQPAGVNDFERGMADGSTRRYPEANCSDDYEHGYYCGSNDFPDDGYGAAHYTTETPA